MASNQDDLTNDERDVWISGPVYVEVQGVGPSSQIGADDARLDVTLDKRIGDVQRAIHQGTAAIAKSLKELPSEAGWDVDQVSASFGIQFGAEARVWVAKATAGATFEVTVTFRRSIPATS